MKLRNKTIGHGMKKIFTRIDMGVKSGEIDMEDYVEIHLADGTKVWGGRVRQIPFEYATMKFEAVFVDTGDVSEPTIFWI